MADASAKRCHRLQQEQLEAAAADTTAGPVAPAASTVGPALPMACAGDTRPVLTPPSPMDAAASPPVAELAWNAAAEAAAAKLHEIQKAQELLHAQEKQAAQEVEATRKEA